MRRRNTVFAGMLVLFVAVSLSADAAEPSYQGVSLQSWMKRLSSSDPKVRSSAAVAMAHMGPQADKAVPLLAKALSDRSDLVRANAAFALARMGPKAQEAIPSLTLALGDPNWEVRGRAAVAIGNLGRNASGAEYALRSALRDPNGASRAAAAGALWQVTGNGMDALPVLAGLLTSSDETTRANAADALARVGPAAHVATGALLETLDDPNPIVRACAARAVGAVVNTADPAACDAVEQALERLRQDPDPNVREAAGAGLSTAQARAEAAQPVGRPLPTARGDLTRYLEPLRRHKASLEAIKSEMAQITPNPKPRSQQEAQQWVARVKAAGRKASGEGRAFGKTLGAFLAGETRGGLAMEIDLVKANMGLFSDLVDRYKQLTGLSQKDYDYTLEEVLLHDAKDYLREELKDKFCEKLEIGGLRSVLDARSWDDAWHRTLTTLGKGVKATLDQETQRAWGISFHDARTARAAIRQRVNAEVEKRVMSLILEVTTNKIVVRIANELVISWLKEALWPRLREFFREKGRLPERLARSAATLKEAENRLWALPPDAHIKTVKTTIWQARGTIYATRYLERDLAKTNTTEGEQMLGQLTAGQKRLASVIDQTSARFLLNKRQAVRELAGDSQILSGLITVIDRMTARVKTPAVQAGPIVTAPARPPTPAAPQVQKPPLVRFNEPLYLIHFIRYGTLSGPVNAQGWFLHNSKPKPDGDVGVADGSGGVVHYIADKYLGPFATNHEVGPALAANKIPSASWGRCFIDGDPKVWK